MSGRAPNARATDRSRPDAPSRPPPPPRSSQPRPRRPVPPARPSARTSGGSPSATAVSDEPPPTRSGGASAGTGTRSSSSAPASASRRESAISPSATGQVQPQQRPHLPRIELAAAEVQRADASIAIRASARTSAMTTASSRACSHHAPETMLSCSAASRADERATTTRSSVAVALPAPAAWSSTVATVHCGSPAAPSTVTSRRTAAWPTASVIAPPVAADDGEALELDAAPTTVMPMPGQGGDPVTGAAHRDVELGHAAEPWGRRDRGRPVVRRRCRTRPARARPRAQSAPWATASRYACRAPARVSTSWTRWVGIG